AYSADLSSFSGFVGAVSEAPGTETVGRYLDHLMKSGLSMRSVARRLTTLRNFYGFLLREGLIAEDPTDHLRSPKQWQTIPKFLNSREIERLIEAPDSARPTGLRDGAMMEVLYASGLRVSELCRLGVADVNLELGYLRATGKGNKQRLVPVGKPAIRAVEQYLRDGRGAMLKGRASRYLFV